MTSTRLGSTLVALSIGVLAVVGLSACGSDDDAQGPACTVVEPTDGMTLLTVTGKNLAFDVNCFEIEPGPVEFTFHNEDANVAHNLHLTGPDVNVATDLEPGKTTQSLSAELIQPGRYDFVCDPHATMEGSIIVVDPAAASTTAA